MIIQLLLSERIGGAETLARSLEAHWTGEGVATSTIFLDEEAATSPIRRVLNLRKRLIAGRASVVVAHSALPSIYARIAAPRGVPVISVLHSATDDFVDPVLRFAEFALRMRTAAVVAVSEAQAAVYRRRFDRNLRVIPNAIRDNLPLGTGSGSCAVPTIVTVARIAIQKNPRLWLDAQGALGERAKFVWFGPLDLPASSLQEEVLAVRRKSPSLFPGSVIDPGDVLASADLLFHPADREAASIGLLEAAAVGLPIVCSQAVARTLPREAVVREFETDNARSAEAVLRQALSDLASLRAAALEAAPLIRQQSSVAQTSEMYLELIGELRAVARKTR